MARVILVETTAGVSELKKNPMGTLAASEGFPIAILNRNEPVFYCVPANAWDALGEWRKLLAPGASGSRLVYHRTPPPCLSRRVRVLRPPPLGEGPGMRACASRLMKSKSVARHCLGQSRISSLIALPEIRHPCTHPT